MRLERLGRNELVEFAKIWPTKPPLSWTPDIAMLPLVPKPRDPREPQVILANQALTPEELNPSGDLETIGFFVRLTASTQDALGQDGLPSFNDLQIAMIEAIRKAPERLTQTKLAAATGYRLTGTFKTTAADLCKLGILSNSTDERGKGYGPGSRFPNNGTDQLAG